jgi:hypothetical protein
MGFATSPGNVSRVTEHKDKPSMTCSRDLGFSKSINLLKERRPFASIHTYSAWAYGARPNR